MSENNPSEPAQQSKRAAREPDELYEKLIEQLSFIDASAKAFDEGHTGEAARLATQIRILVFDGWDKDAKSLLSILGIRDSLKYVGTAIDRKLYREALTAHYGHPSISDAMGEVGFLEVLPNDDGSYGLYAPLVEHRYPPDCPQTKATPTMLTFQYWWKSPVIETIKQTYFSREDLIRIMTNQDGGAHVREALINSVFSGEKRVLVDSDEMATKVREN